MGQARTFLSSTGYDLTHARARLVEFLKSINHVALAHEQASFGVTPGKHSHDACLDQVDEADFLVLIIGGRRGGTYVGSERSITNEEYLRARKRSIPILVFVRDDVWKARRLYARNPDGDFSSVVDDVRVFDFIDRVTSESEDNWIRTFNTVEDIVVILREQFSFFHQLFSRWHVERQQPAKQSSAREEPRLLPFPKDIRAELPGLDTPDERDSFVDGLRALHRILKKMISSGASGYDEKTKLLWVMGRYGEFESMAAGAERLEMPEPNFKQYAWGHGKGSRVNSQLRDFGVEVEYDFEYFEDQPTIQLHFSGKMSSEIVWAMRRYVLDLAERHEEDGIELFQKFDLRIYRDS